MKENNSKKIESIDSVVVSSGVLSELLGVTDRRIRQLQEEGILDKESRGRYNLVSSIKNYIIHLKTNNDLKDNKNDEFLNYDKERALHEKTKREIAELKLAAMKGEMHNSEDVMRVMNDMLASFRSKILSMPSKLAPMLIARNDMSVIQELIKKEAIEALEELSNYDPALFYGEDYIDLSDNEAEIALEHDVGDEDV